MEARSTADGYNGELANWKRDHYNTADPFQKQKPDIPKTVPTFKELVSAYVERHVQHTANSPTRAVYDVNLMANNHFKSWLDRKVTDLTVEDVLTIKNNCGESHIAANRCVQFVRRLCNWSAGKVDGKLNFWPMENIAKDVSTYDEQPRKIFMEADDLNRFNDAVEKETHVDLKDFLILSINTGARRGDIFSMRWTDIHWERQIWSVPYPKNGESYNVQLLPAAMAVLKRRRKEVPESSEYVFPGPGKTRHIIDLKKPWDAFRKRANLEKFHIHDIRHTVASWAAIANTPLQQIGTALGHRSLQSTQRYAHLIDESVRAARESGQAKMLQMMKAAKKRAKLTVRKPKLLEVANG
jgi:integrase